MVLAVGFFGLYLFRILLQQRSSNKYYKYSNNVLPNTMFFTSCALTWIVGRGDGGRPGFDAARTRPFGPRVDLRYLHSVDMERLLDTTLDEAPALRELSSASDAAGELVPLVEGGLPKALAAQLEQRDADALHKWATDSPLATQNLNALLASIPLDVDLLTLAPKVLGTLSFYCCTREFLRFIGTSYIHRNISLR